MAKKEVLELEVKSNIKTVTQDTDKMAESLDDVNKEAKEGIGNFTLMGVSLNGVKQAFTKAAITAKGMFGSIKAGLISTGLGAFVVLVGSLVSYFTNTKKGSEALTRTLAGLGAVVDRITDLFSNVGETMVGAFNDPKKAIEDLWEAIKKNLMNRLTGIIDGFKAVGKVIQGVFSMDWDKVAEGAREYGHALVQVVSGYDTQAQKEFYDNIMEINEGLGLAYKAQVALTEATQKLKDEERDFSKVRAQTRQDIQKARLDALDETKTAEERLKALQTANDLELQTVGKSLKMQRERIRVKTAENEINKSLEEDLDELAQLEVGLIDLKTQSFQTQKRLATEMETLTNEINAAAIAKYKEEQAAIQLLIDLETERANNLIIKSAKLLDDYYKTQLEAQDREKNAIIDKWNFAIQAEEEGSEKRIELEEAMQSELAAIDEKYRVIKKTADDKADAQDIVDRKATEDAKASIRNANIANIDAGIALTKQLAGENKAVMAGAIIAENASAVAKILINTATANAKAVAASPLTTGQPWVGINTVGAVLGIASAAAATAQGLSALGEGGEGGGGGGANGLPSASSEPPSQQMMSGSFELTGGQEVEPVQAYVVSDQITDNQNALEIIRRRATI